MIRRQPKATKKISHFADKYGISAKTLKRIAAEKGWTQIRYGNAPTSPIYLYESVVNQFFQERQNG